MVNIKKIQKINLIRWLIFPIILLLVWIALIFYSIYRLDSAVSVLSYTHTKSSINNLSGKRILAGQKVTGSFKAVDNNLGIVSIRFRTFKRVAFEDEDIFYFRLKEKGQKNWYYSQTYKSGLFFNVPFYTFGFPIIKNSKDKTYVFELESTLGNSYNSVAISDREPVLITKYQEDKSALLKDKKAFIIFLWKKFFNSFQLVDIKFLAFIYLLPFIFFTVLQVKLQKFIGKVLLQIRSHFNLFLILVIIIYVFYMQIESDLVYVVIIGLWITTIINQKIKASYTFYTTFFFLFICAIASQFTYDSITEQLGAWAYLFLIVSLGQSLLQLKKVNQ